MITIDNIKTATFEQLDDIIERTEYAEVGVAVCEAAAEDQELRRAAQRELSRRMGLIPRRQTTGALPKDRSYSNRE